MALSGWVLIFLKRVKAAVFRHCFLLESTDTMRSAHASSAVTKSGDMLIEAPVATRRD